ncbi:MAG: cell division protein FtsA [Fusobacteriaceae bacterium]
MPNIKNIVKTVVEVGNAKVKVLVGELYENGTKIKVLAYAESESEGIKKSQIENPEILKNVVQSVIEKVQLQTEHQIEDIVLGMSSVNTRSKTINKKINFQETEIQEIHIEQLFSEAAKDILKSGERILKKELYNIRVNNSGIVRNPIGMVGKEIQGDIHFICVDELELSNYEEVINRSGFHVEQILLNSIGSAEAVLDQEEKEKGVALIDIGEGLTDILIFKNSKLIYSKSIPLGAMHYINDLAYILEVSKIEAIEVLKKFEEYKENEKYFLISSGRKFTISHIKNIIDARTGDITKFILETIEESGFNGYLGRGIVLTGGASLIDELIEKIISQTGYRVTIKEPPALRGMENVTPSMSSIIGIFLEILKEEIQKIEKKNMERKEEKEFSFNNNSVTENINKDSFIENTSQKNEIIFEEIEEEQKKNIFNRIFDWLSNYI